MSVFGRLNAKRAKQSDMFCSVAQVIFSSNDMRDVHLEIVHHVNKMKHRLAIRTDDDEIRVELLAVGELASDVANDQVRNDDRLARHFKSNSSLVLVGEAVGKQRFYTPLVICFALTLEIRAVITFARPGGIGADGPLIPIQPKPS